jgi:hypothetical protein
VLNLAWCFHDYGGDYSDPVRQYPISSTKTQNHRFLAADVPSSALLHPPKFTIILKWRQKLESELEEVERGYTEFKKEMGRE